MGGAMTTTHNTAHSVSLTKHLGRFFATALLVISACSSPVDPMAEQLRLDADPAVQAAGKTQPIRKTQPVLEVTYLMWSEKGMPAEVDIERTAHGDLG